MVMVKDSQFDLSKSPGQLLHRAQQFAVDHFTQNTRETGKLTQRQFAVLAATADKPGLTQTELVRATGIDRSTLAELVSRMVKTGMIRREAAKSDARANQVFLTNEGVDIYNRALPGAQAADEAILASLPKNKRSGFLKTLRKISMTIEEAEERAKARKAKDKAKAKKAREKAIRKEKERRKKERAKAKKAKRKAEKT